MKSRSLVALLSSWESVTQVWWSAEQWDQRVTLRGSGPVTVQVRGVWKVETAVTMAITNATLRTLSVLTPGMHQGKGLQHHLRWPEPPGTGQTKDAGPLATSSYIPPTSRASVPELPQIAGLSVHLWKRKKHI